jgi:phosphoglycerate dehydrogenase-like enzyme
MSTRALRIVFHGQNAAQFRPGFEDLVGSGHQIDTLDDDLSTSAAVDAFTQADVLIGIRLQAQMPRLHRLQLYHAPAAGTDAIEPALLPASCSLCNCFGHEQAIAEYVFAALLSRHVPLAQADADLRRQRWTYWAGAPGALRTELGSQTLGVIGLGHIGRTIAARARAFGMRVHGCNRSAGQADCVDQFWALSELEAFMASVDAVVVTLPLLPDTRSLVGARALAAIAPHAVLINVGRGPVVDEQALYDALKGKRLGGAVIDTWYQYPGAGQTTAAPSSLDFASLDHVLMTPHMSGWTHGTVQRRRQTLADNVCRLAEGRPLLNLLRGPRANAT